MGRTITVFGIGFLCISLSLQALSAQDRIEEIRSIGREIVKTAKEADPPFFLRFEEARNTGHLYPVREGNGGVYALFDPEGTPLFIIKPSDEDLCCINNPKEDASPDPGVRARIDIPSYEATQRESLAYEVALLAGLADITPKTYPGFLHDPAFFFSSPEENDTYDKFCSVQEFLPKTRSLYAWLQEFFANEYPETELEHFLSEEDFAKILLFTWLTFDNDAHAQNVLVEERGIGYPIRMKKIDNALSFPERNTGWFSFLSHLPHASRPVSSSIRNRIESLSSESFKPSFQKFHLLQTFPPFVERIALLQTLILRQEISYYEITLRLQLLSDPKGSEYALFPLSVSGLEDLILKK